MAINVVVFDIRTDKDAGIPPHIQTMISDAIKEYYTRKGVSMQVANLHSHKVV